MTGLVQESKNTHRVFITLKDDASRVLGRRPAFVSILVHHADGAIFCCLWAGLDVSQVVSFAINDNAGSQKAHCRQYKMLYSNYLPAFFQ